MWRLRPTAADQLNLYWDGRGARQSDATSEIPDLDPTLIDTVERLHARDDARLPNSEFLDRLEQTLIDAAALKPGLAPTASPAAVPIAGTPRLGTRSRRPVFLDTTARSGLPVGQMATAALITLTLVASFVAFGPGRPQRQESASVLVPAIGTLGTPRPATSGTVVEFLWETKGGPDLPLDNPGALAIGSDGNLWVADRARDAFQIFSPDGAFVELWGESGSGEGQFNFNLHWPGGAVAFDDAGNLFVADPGNHRVQKFSPDRTFLMAWGTEGKESGQFISPASVAVDGQGRVYVEDDQRSDVQVFDSDGNYLQTIGRYGFGEGQLYLTAGGSVTLDAAGNVWVTNVGSQRIEKFSPDGLYLATVGSYGTTEDNLSAPGQVAVDGEGRVFAAAGETSRVLVYGPDGAVVASWGGQGSGPGEFHLTKGIVLDGRGNIYVGDSSDDRVQKFRLLPPVLAERPPQ